LNEIYTELYITKGDSGDVNKEHEVKQIEAASRRNPTEDTPIKCSDIFKPLPEQDKAIRNILKQPLSKEDEEPIRDILKKSLSEQDEERIRDVLKKLLSEQDEEPIRNFLKKLSSEQDEEPIRDILKKLFSEQDEERIRDILKKLLSEQDEGPIRNVLTKGVAGIGKTVSVQKFVLDWAEGRTNQDVHLIFPIPFRELNLKKDQKLSLVELLHVFFKEMKELDISRLEKVLFIFDGLDECRFPLDFQKTVRVCDVTESAPVHVLLINLIKGNLLPSALIWITSRPAAADQIPSECVHRVTEVRGFNDPQKEEYFRKRISDQNLANKIITHLKSLRSLYIMCHIPVFCWISAAVLERMLGEAESGEIPKTLSQMYTHFLIIQTNIIREKYLQKQESDEEMLLKLGKVAYQQLEKQNLIFYEEDLRECGIEVTKAAVYSGVCTQIFREEFVLHQSKVYCFVHLSIQEHLAALYVHLTFMKEQRNVLIQNQVCRTLSDVHKSAVDHALDCQTGRLDLFLRFLLGLSFESNQKLLYSLVTQTGSSSQNKKTVQYIKKKISRNINTEKSINLFHCLNELGDDSLVEEIQQYLKSGAQSELSPSQWSALVFVLLTSAQDLEEFDLNKYITPDKIRDEILVRVMPVIAASRKAICSKITKRSSIEALTSVLNSETSSLRELHLTVNTLNLSWNKLEDSGVKRLSALLENPECKVKDLRNVLTKGVAGIGKTVSVQKFVLDWAEGKTNQDVHLIFPLPFRELNLMKEQKLSLVELLHVFFKEMKEIDISRLEKVLFIFDGLDECRFPLDFQKTVRVCDVTESAPVHVLLINLIKGNLLPSALIWITSRPAAADQIPSECVHRVTEVRGFNDPQKEEYFRKRISDQNLANKIITHLKSLRSLYIMCHIPVFCWISAAVLERMLGKAGSGEIPKTLSQMYTHFLIIQTNIIREKYLQKQESDEEMLLKLGKLAFQQLEKQNLIFYEEDLRECDIDVTEAAVYSGVCTQIFREEFGFHQSKVYCFVHLSIQEHLTALYVHLTFMKEQRNVLKQNQDCRTLSDVHRSAVDQALKSQTGHLDIFLRFLLGLSLESNQKLLHSLVTQTGSSSQNKKETVQYIKKKISEDLPAEKSINLFHCLNELGDDSLVEEIQQYLKYGAQSELSPSQWSALVFVLLTSAQNLKEFDLNKYITPDKIRDEILVRVMPVIAASRKAIIRCNTITKRSGEALTSVLNSETSSLRELHLTVNTLDLTGNKLKDSGVKRLSALLENPECKVKDLRLERCGVSGEGCAALASALRSNPSHLRKLELTNNKVGDSGVKCLSAVLENPHCKLEILRLYNCEVSDEGCAALASALRSNPSHLRDLSLSGNKVGDSGVKCLSAVLENPHCKLEKLWLWNCGISDEGCAALASALRLNPSHLKKLDLSRNNVGESGVKCLSDLKDDKRYKLQTLK
ncbi:NACHT, LRR and PYD domains-containing protein 12 isoform X4, partial [Silurus asotus]